MCRAKIAAARTPVHPLAPSTARESLASARGPE
jgi:hypothetical protein